MDVEKVLAEFKVKDWSSCKKQLKGDLTCYHCKDDKGVRHEECMYISGTASDPKASQLKYTEVKKYRKTDVTKDDDIEADQPQEEQKKKLRKKLIVRKRKARIGGETKTANLEAIEAAAPKPEDVGEHQPEDEVKSTIKRTVSYHFENSNEQVPAESRIMMYEHKILHSL